MPVLWNPTTENFDTTFEGIMTTIHGVSDEHPEGQMIRVDKARASHLVNIFGPRGLALLEYGDNEGVKGETVKDRKGESALQLNQEFKERQVMNYNTLNEQQKQGGKPFVKPTSQVVKYAAELGVELISPYAVKTEESKRMAKLEGENSDLRGQMSKMMDRMSEMMMAIQNGGQVPKEKTDEEYNIDKLKNKFIRLGKDNYKSWVKENSNELAAWPLEVQDAARDKWRGMFPDSPYPLESAA